MDESGDEAASRKIHPKLKYMRQLQSIADRTSNQIIVDLDDLSAVCCLQMYKKFSFADK